MRWMIPVLLVALLAGCAGQDNQGTDSTDSTPEMTAMPMVVVADIDTGVNPYHIEFRDDSPQAFLHPSTYLPGFPKDAQALNLSLDAEDYETAVLQDCDIWQNIDEQALYWIPGTRIVGAITFDAGSTECVQGNLPGAILDRGGHGTMTISRVAGDQSSLCPMCKIVAIQGFTGDAMVWAAEQPFIDVQTNSWGDLPAGYVMDEGELAQGNHRESIIEAASKQAIFVAGGNGLAGFFGVTGHPAYFDNIAGPDGIIMVGGHDNGMYTPWTMTLPHIVADANAHPAARLDSMEERNERGGGGTSGATPFSAGTFARTLYEVRAAMGDTGVGYRNGTLVVPATNATLPSSGPMEDGVLSLREAKFAFYRTALPEPVEDGYWDGPRCAATDCIADGSGLYSTVPVTWDTLPAGLPLYYFVGYGQVGNVTLQGHVDAFLGLAPIPDRMAADMFYSADETARQAFDDLQP